MDNPPKRNENLLTVKEAVEYWPLSRRTIFRLIGVGFPSVMVLGKRLFLKDQGDNWIERNGGRIRKKVAATKRSINNTSTQEKL